MKKRNRITVGILLFVGVMTLIGYNYIYQDHRDIATEESVYVLTASQLIQDFQDHEADATQKYLNKTITVKGTLQHIDETSLVIEDVIFFALSENTDPPTPEQINKLIQVKGRCIGYDSLLEEVKFDQASIVNP